MRAKREGLVGGGPLMVSSSTLDVAVGLLIESMIVLLRAAHKRTVIGKE